MRWKKNPCKRVSSDFCRLFLCGVVIIGKLLIIKVCFRAYYGNINFFGGPSPECAKSSTKLLQKEQENESAMFIFLSDVWLDQVSTGNNSRV